MSALQTNLQELIQKEVSRNNFLVIPGLFLLTILRFGTFLNQLIGKSFETNHILGGYGDFLYSDVYGKKGLR